MSGYYNNSEEENKKINEALDKGYEVCENITLNDIQEIGCKSYVKAIKETTKITNKPAEIWNSKNNEALDRFNNGGLMVKQSDEAPTQPTVKTTQTPATQTPEEPSRL